MRPLGGGLPYNRVCLSFTLCSACSYGPNLTSLLIPQVPRVLLGGGEVEEDVPRILVSMVKKG